MTRGNEQISGCFDFTSESEKSRLGNVDRQHRAGAWASVNAPAAEPTANEVAKPAPAGEPAKSAGS